MTLALIYSRTEVFMSGEKKKNKKKRKKGKQEIHKMCRLPPRLLYNWSRTEQEGVFYPSWSLICAGKTEIRAHQTEIPTHLHGVLPVGAPTHRKRVV